MKVVCASFLVQQYHCVYQLALGSAGCFVVTHVSSGRQQVIPLSTFLSMTEEAFLVVLTEISQ